MRKAKLMIGAGVSALAIFAVSILVETTDGRILGLSAALAQESGAQKGN